MHVFGLDVVEHPGSQKICHLDREYRLVMIASICGSFKLALINTMTSVIDKL